MENNEDYLDTAYSDGTLAIDSESEQAIFSGEDDEKIYTRITADAEQAIPAQDFNDIVAEEFSAEQTMPTKAFGDMLVEEFSAEETAKKVTKLTKLNETTVNYILSFIYLAVGITILVLHSYIGSVFSYIVGSFMAVIGLGQFIFAIRTKEYAQTNSNKTAMSLILMALAVLIIVEKDSANTIVAIAWGFLGLLEGAHAFNHAFSRIAKSQRCTYFLVKGLIEVVLAFLLLHDPINHLGLHIIVLGVNFVFDAITMFPPIKKILSKK
jgi:uncharacterized membrane protein HdeD (DUF308 family)